MQSRAGGAGRKDSDIHVVRSVPKFLQGHMHLLGRKPPQEEEEAQLATVDESEQQRKDDDADEQVFVLPKHPLSGWAGKRWVSGSGKRLAAGPLETQANFKPASRKRCSGRWPRIPTWRSSTPSSSLSPSGLGPDVPRKREIGRLPPRTMSQRCGTSRRPSPCTRTQYT